MNNDRISSSTLLAYSGIALPLALAEVPIIIYLPAFYAKELSLETGLVGMVFLLARLFDGLFDLLIGWFSDRSTSRFGRRKPLVLAAMPILLTGIWLLCNPPSDAGLVYLGVCTALFYIGLTLLKIPYWSWGVEISADYTERSRITSYREFFSMLGNFLLFTAPLLLLSENASLGAVLNMIALAVVILLPLTAFPLALLVPDPPQKFTAQRPSWKAGVRSVLSNGAARRFLVAFFFFWLSSGVINAVAVFSFGTGLGLPSKLFLIILLLYVSMMLNVPVVVWLSRRFEKHHLLAFGMLLLVCGFGGMMFVPYGRLDLVIAIWLLAGIGNAFVATLPMSLLADIVDHGASTGDDRHPGTYVAAYNLVLKLGSALGVGLSFGLLELLNFVPDAARHTAIDVSNIRWVGFALPCLLLIPVLLLTLTHPITRRKRRQHAEAFDGGG